MSLVSLNNGWKRFGNGRIWRCKEPDFICEVDTEGNIPSYSNKPSSVSIIRRVKSFYAGQIHSYGNLDANRNALDILTANSMAESFGTVPTPFDYKELSTIYLGNNKPDAGDRLREVIDYIQIRSKWLVRKEPGYVNPLATPSRISLGAHHILLSTAIDVSGKQALSRDKKNDFIKDLVFRLPSVSSFAADLAISYFNKSSGKHFNELPLLAATYNAGSPRPDSSNPWNLKQYGSHIDRWIGYYNTSRLLKINTSDKINEISHSSPEKLATKVLELKVLRKEFSEKSTIGELYADEQFHCYTLEDKYRADETKVYGETAIPQGRYEVVINYSNHFKKNMPQLLNVPGYEGVRIHSGNTDKDTLGCVLVGKYKEKDRIWDCKNVYESMFQKISDSLKTGKCFISIKNEMW